MNGYTFIWHVYFKVWEMRFDNGEKIYGATKEECLEEYAKHK